LYLDNAYWIEHPICKLTGASWYGDKEEKVAEAFVNWINSGDKLNDLENYGLRSFARNNQSTELTDSIISEENGCNLNIERENEYSDPSVITSLCMRQEFESLKKDTQLMILLDVSGNMQTRVSGSETRWAQISAMLPLIPDTLADADTINLTCFNDFVLEGPGCSSTPYPNGTLSATRDALIDYFSDSISPVRKEDNVNLFSSLNEAYRVLNHTQSIEGSKYRYILLVITEDDNSENSNENAIDLLESISLSFNSEQIHIYPILYYGLENGITATTLQELAKRTNGQFSTATSETLGDIITEFIYYW